MKLIALLALSLLFQPALSQSDYSGIYGYSFKVKVDSRGVQPPKDETDAGPSGSLTILKIDKNQYKFWLDISKGWPNYHIGFIDGILTVNKNKGLYKGKMDYVDSACILEFTFINKAVKIEQHGTDSDCGFGAFVYADGNYKKKIAGKISVKEFHNLYMDASSYRVRVSKALVFADSSGINNKNQYFILNDEILSTRESDNYIYIEHLTKAGKFIYGWLRKSEVEYNNN